MNNIATVFLNGLTYGGLLFMSASGLTLMLGLMRIVNMAHGTYYLMGAFIGLIIYQMTGNWFIAIAAGGIFVAVFMLIVRMTLFPKVIGNEFNVMLLTLGISYIVSDTILAVFGANIQIISPPPAISDPVNLGFVNYPGTRIFILIIAALQGLFMWWLMNKTRMGQFIRAGVDNRTIASAMGINIDRVFTFVFVLSGLLVGLSGVMGGSYTSFAYGTEGTIQSYSLVVVILGGMGSLMGAAVGAILVGLLDSFCKAIMPQMTSVVIFGTLMLILAFRPTGLFGKER